MSDDNSIGQEKKGKGRKRKQNAFKKAISGLMTEDDKSKEASRKGASEESDTQDEVQEVEGTIVQIDQLDLPPNDLKERVDSATEHLSALDPDDRFDKGPTVEAVTIQAENLGINEVLDTETNSQKSMLSYQMEKSGIVLKDKPEFPPSMQRLDKSIGIYVSLQDQLNNIIQSHQQKLERKMEEEEEEQQPEQIELDLGPTDEDLVCDCEGKDASHICSVKRFANKILPQDPSTSSADCYLTPRSSTNEDDNQEHLAELEMEGETLAEMNAKRLLDEDRQLGEVMGQATHRNYVHAREFLKKEEDRQRRGGVLGIGRLISVQSLEVAARIDDTIHLEDVYPLDWYKRPEQDKLFLTSQESLLPSIRLIGTLSMKSLEVTHIYRLRSQSSFVVDMLQEAVDWIETAILASLADYTRMAVTNQSYQQANRFILQAFHMLEPCCDSVSAAICTYYQGDMHLPQLFRSSILKLIDVVLSMAQDDDDLRFLSKYGKEDCCECESDEDSEDDAVEGTPLAHVIDIHGPMPRSHPLRILRPEYINSCLLDCDVTDLLAQFPKRQEQVNVRIAKGLEEPREVPYDVWSYLYEAAMREPTRVVMRQLGDNKQTDNPDVLSLAEEIERLRTVGDLFSDHVATLAKVLSTQGDGPFKGAQIVPKVVEKKPALQQSVKAPLVAFSDLEEAEDPFAGFE